MSVMSVTELAALLADYADADPEQAGCGSAKTASPYLGVAHGHGEHQAAVHPAPVEQHRAGAALAVIAAVLRGGVAQSFPRASNRVVRVSRSAGSRLIDPQGDLGAQVPTLPGGPVRKSAHGPAECRASRRRFDTVQGAG
jgi:hypothetical protein